MVARYTDEQFIAQILTYSWPIPIMIGSGFSSSVGMPSWLELFDGIPEKYNLPHLDSETIERQMRDGYHLDYYGVAQKISDQMTSGGISLKREIARKIKIAATEKHVCPSVYNFIVDLGFNRIMTLNYDRLIERAFDDRKKILNYYDRGKHPDPERADTAMLLKLHGSVDHPANMILIQDDIDKLNESWKPIDRKAQGWYQSSPVLHVGMGFNDASFLKLRNRMRDAPSETDRIPDFAIVTDDVYSETLVQMNNMLGYGILVKKADEIMPFLKKLFDTLKAQKLLVGSDFTSPLAANARDEFNFVEDIREKIYEEHDKIDPTQSARKTPRFESPFGFPPANLLGREEFTKSAYHELINGRTGRIAFSGQAGLGKTQLGREIARMASADHDVFPGGILWIESDTETEVSLLEKIRTGLSVPSRIMNARLNSDDNAEFRKYITKARPLVIVDHFSASTIDAWSPVLDAFGDLGGCKQLIIFQDNTISRDNTYKTFSIGALNKKDHLQIAKNYFLDQLLSKGKSNADDKVLAELLFDESYLRGVPGMWRAAASSIYRNDLSLSEYMEKMKKDPKQAKLLLSDPNFEHISGAEIDNEVKDKSYYYAIYNSVVQNGLDIGFVARALQACMDYSDQGLVELEQIQTELAKFNGKNLSEDWQFKPNAIRELFKALDEVGLVELRGSGVYYIPYTTRSLSEVARNNADYETYFLSRLMVAAPKLTNLAQLEKIHQDWFLVSPSLRNKPALRKHAATVKSYALALEKAGWHKRSIDMANQARNLYARLGDSKNRQYMDDHILHQRAALNQLPVSTNPHL